VNTPLVQFNKSFNTFTEKSLSTQSIA